MSKLSVGQNVIHKTHGFGTVHGIEEREFNRGELRKFYILAIQDNGCVKKVFVPFESVSERVRPLISKAEGEKILALLAFSKSLEPIDHQTWNRRYREYMELIHSGNAEAIARVLVALRTLQAEKALSFGERKLMQQAESLLRAELSAVGLELP